LSTPAHILPAKYRPWFRGAADYGPLVIFAIAYFLKVHLVHGDHGWSLAVGGPGKRDLTDATWWLVGGSAIGLGAVLAVERRIAPVPLMMGGIALVFGVLTLVFHDAIFLKLKPTIIDVSYAVGLLVAWLLKRNPLKAMMGAGLHLSNESWRTLTLRYALFFLASGLANIVVWQTLSEEIWVLYKVGGQMALLLLFSASQMPFVMKHMQDPPEPEAAEADPAG
jgi:intracellular septation protein